MGWVLLAATVGSSAAPSEQEADAAAASAPTEGRAPAVLLCAWDRPVDRTVVEHLQSAGFVVDAISHRDLGWDRLRQFNVVVMLGLPPGETVSVSPFGAPAGGPGLTATMDLLDRFLEAGGGVMLIAGHLSGEAYEAMNRGLARWDAAVPLSTLEVPADRTVAHPRLAGLPFFFADAVAPSPVSEGVAGVWVPVPRSHVEPHNLFSGPIAVGDRWQVVLRAGSEVATVPVDQSGIAAERRVDPPTTDTLAELPPTNAPLFAIRDLAPAPGSAPGRAPETTSGSTPGRVAFFRTYWVFHLGSGHSWLHNAAMLTRGLNDRPSDFQRLLTNTFDWLAEPSLAANTLGGATVPADRWLPPNLRPDAIARGTDRAVYPADPAPVRPSFRGIIGPRTALSAGQGTVADYADAARAHDLDFIIFLEDFAHLEPAELDTLIADCRAHSSDDLQLFPGYRMRTNLGNQVFFFGRQPLYPHDNVRTGPDRRTFMLQSVNSAGEFRAGNESLHFVFAHKSHGGGDVNSVGYFDFTGPQQQGGLGVADLRAFSMAGIRFYDRGTFVEDVTDQYLLTNAGTMTGTPVAIHLLDSPEAMIEAARNGQGLTFAGARDHARLWEDALRWNHTYISPHAYPSQGPIIDAWPDTVRQATYGAEDFVVEANRLPARLRVTSDVGLKEVRIHDGTALFRRYLPGGATEFERVLYLNAHLQRNLSVVAVDVEGRQAVSTARRFWKPGSSPAPKFCADHVNDCQDMKLARGVFWPGPTAVPELDEAGHTWDGGPRAFHPLLDFQHYVPAVQSDAGEQGGRPVQVPRLIFADERVYRGGSTTDRVLTFDDPHAQAWTGYGPTQPAPLFNAEVLITEFFRFPRRVVAEGWTAQAVHGGSMTALVEQTFTFTRPQRITSISLGGTWRQPLPVGRVTLLVDRGDGEVQQLDGTPGSMSQPLDVVLAQGGWIGAVSDEPANAMLWINRGDTPVRCLVDARQLRLSVALPADGWPVDAGDTCAVELATIGFPMDADLRTPDAMLAAVAELRDPTGLTIERGQRREAPLGLLELDAHHGAATIQLPRSPHPDHDLALPLRVHGLNPRWATILHQHTGHNGAHYYGPGTNRVRPLGIDEHGRAYTPIFNSTTDTHLTLGHPITADDNAQDLFIQALPLTANRDGIPTTWHITLHNPTDTPITTTVRRNIDAPGLPDVPNDTITIPPGSDVTLP